MDKNTGNRWRKYRPTTRRLVQVYSALLHNAYLKGFLDGEIYKGNTKILCAPGLNCYSCPGAVSACPLGALQNAVAATGHRAGWYVAGILLLFGVMLGRTICGWLCPFGLIQELLHRIPMPKIRKNRITGALSLLKYVLLAVFVLLIPLWYGLGSDMPVPAFCKYICPAGTLEGAIGLLAHPGNSAMYSMLGELFTRKCVILIIIGLACVFCYRSFCRFICPLGAVYGLFNRVNLIGVKVNDDRCSHCNACVSFCEMDVRRVGDHECIHCGRCMKVCPEGAISVKAGRITLKASDSGSICNEPQADKKHRIRTRVLWCILLAALGTALLLFNAIAPSGTEQTQSPEQSLMTAVTEIPAGIPETSAGEEENAPPTGYEVGQRPADFMINCYDGSGFHLADTRGKAVMINLWATYCAPCKSELPYFNELYLAHRDDLAMLIVHSSLITDDPEVYLADKGFQIPFATDTDEDIVFRAVGGSGTLPQTIVLNRKGEVIYNQTGSVTPEKLAMLYDEASR